MTFVIPFDGSELAEAAVMRAVEFASIFEEPVVAVSVVPRDNTAYARDKGWIGPTEPFDLEAVLATLRDQVSAISDDVAFESIVVDRYAPPGVIARRIRSFASEVDATLVFIGSENAGRLITSVHSVGGGVAAGSGYDVVLVRQRGPLAIERLAAASPFDDDPVSGDG